MIAIVKYNSGNTRSVINALNRLGVEPHLTDNPEELQSADKVIFPGVGAAGSAMKHLEDRGLEKVLIKLEQPFLGICLGMQLMCSYSEENDTKLLNIFPETVEAFRDVPKIPHMGWNQLQNLSSPLFRGIDEGAHAYFVHSYKVASAPETIATANYGSPFSAALQKGNFYGVQFHPEKSAKTGVKILKNFLEL